MPEPLGPFARALAELQPKSSAARRWLFVAEDQLSAELGPLSREAPAALGIVLIESRWKAAQRPYHRHRLALNWANQRHFALEQARRGVAVRYEWSDRPFAGTLEPIAKQLGPLGVMVPAERELREDLRPLQRAGLLRGLPHEGWLTTTEDFAASHTGPPWKMDSFYRHVRRRTGVLMEGEQYVGGKVSFDTENREPWSGQPPPAQPPAFTPDAITREVIELVERDFARHPGRVDAASLPATLADAERLWAWALKSCLPSFGPYEDAMSLRSRTIFHTRISALMNLHRLLPARVVADAERASIPLASKEGFIRQVLGWREFVRHVHEATDGFRSVRGRSLDALPAPGDGGYARWAGQAWPAAESPAPGGATPAELGGDTPLPPAYWGKPSGLACLDEVVRSVWDEAYSHHITRLMVLSNLATLLDVSPRELTDWFWVAYADAWDWVVEPNVLGMGTYAVGPVMTTKPYVAGSAYIDRMSDYCSACAFDPKTTCPITRLYWAFLARHEPALKANPRLFMPMNALRKRAQAQRDEDRRVFLNVREVLVRGKKLTPDRPPPPPPSSTPRRKGKR
jgi:deoxyribodipyrimidine photolyase-related protein